VVCTNSERPDGDRPAAILVSTGDFVVRYRYRIRRRPRLTLRPVSALPTKQLDPREVKYRKALREAIRKVRADERPLAPEAQGFEDETTTLSAPRVSRYRRFSRRWRSKDAGRANLKNTTERMVGTDKGIQLCEGYQSCSSSRRIRLRRGFVCTSVNISPMCLSRSCGATAPPSPSAASANSGVIPAASKRASTSP